MVDFPQRDLAVESRCRVRCFVTHLQEGQPTVFEKNLLAGKRILVTGGATGLGKSMGKRFLELGASLYICGRREEVLQQTADELQSATGGKVKTFSCDVRDNARVEAMIEQFWQDGPLDVLVNNAAGNFISRTEDLSIG